MHKYAMLLSRFAYGEKVTNSIKNVARKDTKTVSDNEMRAKRYVTAKAVWDMLKEGNEQAKLGES